MAEAEEGSTSQNPEIASAEAEAEADGAQALADVAAMGPSAGPPVKTGPGRIVRSVRWLLRWHPLIFLGCSLCLALYAWMVFPESETRTVPPADAFYYDGLDRLYRVINPDLPLIAATPTDEALAARNAILNLFVFYRDTLGDYPEFINPHLLLGETNRMLAEFNPDMVTKYWQDAQSAYSDAGLWENRTSDPEKMAIYVNSNFLDGRGRAASADNFLDLEDDEVALRRERRKDYIDYRLAEADVNLNRPELARPVLEDIRRREDGRRREELRLSAQEDAMGGDVSRRAFELGPDEFRGLDLLLAKAYDGLGQLDRARGWYLRYLSSAPAGRNHAFVVERLAAISMGDGEVYRRVNPETASRHYEAAANYYRDLVSSPSVTREQHDKALLGLAQTNSRLAELIQEGEIAGVDELSAAGRTVRRWLEEFSGQPLPRRTLGIPMAIGKTLAKTELILPGRASLPEVVAGNLSAMAGGGLITPHERRRVYLSDALANYDRIAEAQRGTELGNKAAISAAWESWYLGMKKETEARFERMIDPLSSPELILAARLGLAMAALDRNELQRAHMLLLGGYAHPMPLWFTPTDADWRKIAVLLGTAANRAQPGVWRRIWEVLPEEGRDIASYAATGRRLDDDYVNRFLRALNTMLRRDDFYRPEDFPPRDRNFYLSYILDRDPELLTAEAMVWRNRLLLEEAWPYDLAQRAAKGNVGFEPFPTGKEILPGGLVEAERVRKLLLELAEAWATEGRASPDRSEMLRRILESNQAYRAALNDYGGEPGDILYALAHNYETLAEIRELQGNHLEALSLTAEAARSYLDVSLKARGSAREMESLLAAGDAFFRAGLLGRTVESQKRFLERFGYSSLPGSEGALAVVRAENLLGRAYWFLKDTDNALESFRRNIPRRVPDRYKSMYYVGRVLMEEGMAKNLPELLGSLDDPLPVFDRNGDPVLDTALHSFNYLRQSPGINPSARAWRWATFDLAKLLYVFAERARSQWNAEQQSNAAAGDAPAARPWLPLYDQARINLTEALERYPLRRNGGFGLSVRVEPEDYADVMASRFETEYMLANTLLVLADAREDDALYSMARAHLENMRDRNRYAGALFDENLDRFQLNAAVIREEVEGGNWDRNTPLPRTRLGDDEGPTHSPQLMFQTLRNSMLVLAREYFRAGEKARERQLLASADGAMAQPAGDAAAGYYQDSYRVWQDIYDRFGLPFGSEAMVNMGDCLNRMGYPQDASNHYRMARNMAELVPADTRSDGMLDIGPAFWGTIAEQRLRDMRDGYTVP